MTSVGRTDAQLSIVHQKGCYACQWLDNIDMPTYEKFDKNIPCGSKVMSVFTNLLMDGQTDGRIHTVNIVHVKGSCN